jgi:hypothetical protein
MLDFFLSLRLIIVVIILSQVLLACLGIWLIAFNTGMQGEKQTAKTILNLYSDSVQKYVIDRLELDKGCVEDILAEWYNHRLTSENAQGIIFSRAKIFSNSLTSFGISYGDPSISIYYGTERVESNDGSVSYLIYQQFQNETSIKLYSVNNTESGTYDKLSKETKNYNINNRDWYNVGWVADPQLGTWGTPYLTAQSNFLTTYYTKPIFVPDGTKSKRLVSSKPIVLSKISISIFPKLSFQVKDSHF